MLSVQGKWSLMSAGPYRPTDSAGALGSRAALTALTALGVGAVAVVGTVALLRTRGARRAVTGDR
ncbi:hypothetical protein GCM10017778_28940 [Streptomyces vinaceus]|nr:hypothetical protein GCM10017778_28940 [Streptomyces vinaceus]